MAEVSLTISTSNPEEALKFAELVKMFFGKEIKVVANVAKETPSVATKDEPVVHSGATREEAKQEITLDTSLLRTKVATLLEKNAELRPQILAKVKELGAQGVSSLKEDKWPIFNNFLDSLQ